MSKENEHWRQETASYRFSTIHNCIFHIYRKVFLFGFVFSIISPGFLNFRYSSPIHIINICQSELYLAPDSCTFRSTWPLTGTNNLLTMVASIFLQLESSFSLGRHSASPYCSVNLYFEVRFVLIFSANLSVVRRTSTALETRTRFGWICITIRNFFCWCSVNIEFFPTLDQPLYLYRSLLVGVFKACWPILDSAQVSLLFLKSLVAICNLSFVNAVIWHTVFLFRAKCKANKNICHENNAWPLLNKHWVCTRQVWGLAIITYQENHFWKH